MSYGPAVATCLENTASFLSENHDPSSEKCVKDLHMCVCDGQASCQYGEDDS